ncbi:MAG: hypothetical protein HYR60_12445 [Acidobacteria bacterium]|nr:hypothetical protein [Acidobacteriota bacterium]
MNDLALELYLEENGYPAHIRKAGRAGLIRKWRDFVAEVERGYKLGLEDYRNDLDIRGILALAELDQDPEVAAADARFRTLLTERDKRVWESAAVSDAFWDFGYPKNASGVLLEDLKTEDLA